MTTDIPRKIGREYVESAKLPYEDSEHVHNIAQKVARVNAYLFEQIPIEVIFTEKDPYNSYIDMKESIREEQVFKVFSGGTHPDHYTREQNVKGRAVHDWYGHLKADVNFSFTGEYRKWQYVQRYYPPETYRFLFSEVVGQLAAAKYLDNGFSDERFTQRSCIAPYQWIDLTQEYTSVE